MNPKLVASLATAKVGVPLIDSRNNTRQAEERARISPFMPDDWINDPGTPN
jgi:hypothetical protein